MILEIEQQFNVLKLNQQQRSNGLEKLTKNQSSFGSALSSEVLNPLVVGGEHLERAFATDARLQRKETGTVSFATKVSNEIVLSNARNLRTDHPLK